MSADWPIVRLGSYCSKVGSGATPRGGASVYLDTGEICLIRSQNIYNDGFRSDGLVYITPESAEKLKNVVVEKDDVLLNITGDSVARVCLAKENYLPARVNQHVAIIRSDPEEFDARYLRYLLASPSMQNLLLSIAAVGATRNALTKSMIETLEIPKPPLRTQQEIADNLESLDVKIELNRQTNQTLEEMAQAIFKSWFVDFEPTRAKIAAKENGEDPERVAMAAIAGKAIEELDALPAEQLKSLSSTAALFPETLTDSELGEIPDGWVKGELRNIAKFSTDRISVSELSLETYISTENMLEGKRGVSNASSLPTVKTVPSFHSGQILISNIRPYFMKIWLARFEGGRSNDVLGIEANETEGTEYLYNLLYQDTFFNFMLATSKGAKMPRGDKDAIMGWHCVQPTVEVKKAYSKAIKEFYSSIDSMNKENKILEKLRDTLLPKLLSGELEISNAH